VAANSALPSPTVVELNPGDSVPDTLHMDDLVVLYLHGGAFLFDEPADIYATRISSALKAPVVMLHYRLGAEHPFPAASDDTVQTYRHLLDAGWPADRVLVIGHSAGGTLVMALLLSLADESLPMPMGVVSLSGVLDFSLEFASIRDNDGDDSITRAQAEQVAADYCRGADPKDPLVSPALATSERWATAPPLYLLCGGDEIFRDSVVALATSAAHGGADITLRVVPHQQHGFAQRAIPASDRILAEIGAFAERCHHPIPRSEQWIGSNPWANSDDSASQDPLDGTAPSVS
jgi:epsilon-lactone hydrolase